MPIELVVTFVDETKQFFYIPIDLMRGVKKELHSDFKTLPAGVGRLLFIQFL